LIALLAGAAAGLRSTFAAQPRQLRQRLRQSGTSQDRGHSAAPASQATHSGIPARSVLGRIAADPFSRIRGCRGPNRPPFPKRRFPSRRLCRFVSPASFIANRGSKCMWRGARRFSRSRKATLSMTSTRSTR